MGRSRRRYALGQMFENERQKRLASELVAHVGEMTVPRDEQGRLAVLGQNWRQVLKWDVRFNTHLPDETLRSKYVGLEPVDDAVTGKAVSQERNVGFRIDLKRRRNHADDQLTPMFPNLLPHL